MPMTKALSPESTQTRKTADDFANALGAAEHALDVSHDAHAMILVVSLALTTEPGHLSIECQEAVWSAASYAAEKAREARNAVDLACGMMRAEAAHG